jgi:integrase
MRLMECVSLRVKDVDFGRRDIIIRECKGFKDRVTMLPLALAAPLKEQIALAHALVCADRASDRPGVMLPDALERKYSTVAIPWG